jgi:hypothetical protein
MEINMEVFVKYNIIESFESISNQFRINLESISKHYEKVGLIKKERENEGKSRKEKK